MSKHGESRALVLSAIPLLTKELGYPPTMQEIADAVGLRKTTTFQHLRVLALEGRVTWQRGSPRTIRAVRPANRSRGDGE